MHDPDRRYDLPPTHALVPIAWLDRLLESHYANRFEPDVVEEPTTGVHEGGIPRPGDEQVDLRRIQLSPGFGNPGPGFVPRGVAANQTHKRDGPEA